MKERRGNLFTCGDPDAVAITTNGYVKRDGLAVMGRGCAKQATVLYPGIASELGRSIILDGNVPNILVSAIYMPGGELRSPAIVSFPVKPDRVVFDGTNVVQHMRSRFVVGRSVPGWAAKASLALILQSAEALVGLADEHGWDRVNIPRAGCGAGELEWSVVRPMLQEVFDDRFVAISYPSKKGGSS